VRYNDIKFVISLLSIKLSGKRDTVTTDGGGDNTDNHPAIPENRDTSQGIIQINLIS